MPRLDDILAALDAATVRYCLLRAGIPEPAPCDRQEVDLLIAVDDAAQLERIAGDFGFLPLAMWGYAPHRSYVAYEPTRGWLKLDAVTDLCFGRRVKPLRIGIAEECLARRLSATEHLPAPEHELLLLLLHCLLDKEAFPTRHRTRIAAIRSTLLAERDGEERLSACFACYVEPALSWPVCSRAIAAGEWESLLARRRRIAWQIMRRAPFATAARWIGARLLLGLRPLLVALHRRGSAVAILGPEGAGKATLTQALASDPELRARVVTTRGNGGGASRPNAGEHPFAAWLRQVLAGYHRLRGRLVIYDGEREHNGRLIERNALRPDLVLLVETQATTESRKTAQMARALLFENARKSYQRRAGLSAARALGKCHGD